MSTMTLEELKDEYRLREEALVKKALVDSEWRIGPAAVRLGIPIPRLRAMLSRGRHPAVWAEYRKRCPGRGRPLGSKKKKEQ